MKRTPLLLVLLAVLATSCGTKGAEGEPVHIGENRVETFDLGEILDVRGVAVLEERDGFFIRDLSKIRLADEGIFVSDGRKLLRYGRDGHLVSCLDRRGRGNGEYCNISDFFVDDGFIYVLDASKGLYKYDLDGNFVLGKRLGRFMASMHIVSGTSSLLLSSSYQDKGPKFVVLDKETFERKAAFMPIEGNEITWRHFTGQNNFYEHKGRLLFHEPVDNQVLELSADSARVHLSLDFHGRNVPESFLSKKYMNVYVFYRESSENRFCFGLPHFAESGSHLMFTYRDGEDYLMGVYDKKARNSVQFRNVILPGGTASIPVSGISWQFQSEDAVLLVIEGPVGHPALRQSGDETDPYRHTVMICSFKSAAPPSDADVSLRST